MALDFKEVPLAFTGGIDKSDQILVSPGKQTLLTDAQFDDAQTIVTRAGLYQLSLAPKVASLPAPYSRTNPSFTGTPYRMAQNLGTLLLEGVNGLFSRGPYTGGSTGSDGPSMLQVRTDTGTSAGGRPDFTRSHVETDFVGPINDGLTAGGGVGAGFQSYDMARIENYDGLGRVMSMHAWCEYNVTAGVNVSNIHVRVFDEGESTSAGEGAARTQIMDIAIAGGGDVWKNVRVLANSTDFTVLGYKVVAGTISSVLQLTASTGVVQYPAFTTAGGCNESYDAIIDPNNTSAVCVAYNLNTAFMQALTWNLSTLVTTNAAPVATTATPVQTTIVATRTGGTYRRAILYTCTGTQTVIRGMNLSNIMVLTAEVNVITAPSTVGRITAVETGDNVTTTFAMFYDADKALGAGFANTVQVEINKSTLVGTSIISTNGPHIYGRPLVQGNRIHLPVCVLFDDSYPSIFIMQMSVNTTAGSTYPSAGNVVALVTARIHWGQAGNIIPNWSYRARIPSTWVDATTSAVIFPATRWNAQSVSTVGAVQSSSNIYQARCYFTTQSLGYAESNGDTILAGSCPQNYDGSFFEETGFNYRPVILSVVVGGVGGLSAGSYILYATYKHTDARGVTTESMPSLPFTFTGVAGQGYTPTAIGTNFTAKQNVQVCFYRTTAGSATGNAYLDTSVNATFSAGRTDAQIIGNTPLPTTGGVLPNEAPVASRVTVEHQNRLWSAGSEDGLTVYFSQPISKDIAPEWNRLLKRYVPKSFGRVVNMVSLDDKLVIFCENRIGFIYGTGPTRTGAQDGYSEIVEALSGYAIPWNQPHGIVRTSDGIWFRCGFGFRLLLRNLTIAKDGDGADLASEIDTAVVNNNVVRALISSTAQQVRFYMSGGSTVYVYDLIYKQWSQFTGFSAVDSTAIGDDFYHLENVPALYVQNKNAVNDYGNLITPQLETAWIAFAGIQHFQRVSYLQIIGQTPTNDVGGTLIQVQGYYDYNQDSIVNISSSVTFPKVSTSSTPCILQAEFQLARQKCSALKLLISWSSGSASTAKPLRLSSINFTVGLKKGRAKLPAASRF